MGFDLNRFNSAQFQHRTEKVTVSDLSAFFAEGSDPVFTIRGLTGRELGEAKEEAKRNRDIPAALEGLLSANKPEIVEGVKALVGLDGKVTEDIASRLAYLRMGLVDPAIDHMVAVKICEKFPVVFYDLTNRILALTGMGQVPGESPASGETTA